MRHRFSRRERPAPAPPVPAKPEARPLPPNGAEWGEGDKRVDGVTVEEISMQERDKRAAKLNEAQVAGVNALAQLAAQQTAEVERVMQARADALREAREQV